MSAAEQSSWFLPGLEFPLAPLLDHLTCPICMEIMRDATITSPCAHNFCDGCIRAALNLKRECPICKAPAVEENLLPNREWNALVETLDRAKEAAAEQYFDRMLGAGAGAGAGSPPDAQRAAGGADAGSKVEGAFRRHHQQALLAFQSTVEEVRRAFALHPQRLALARAEAEGPATALIFRGSEGVAEELARLETAEEECLGQLAADYELHLTETAVPLPTRGSELQ